MFKCKGRKSAVADLTSLRGGGHIYTFITIECHILYSQKYYCSQYEFLTNFMSASYNKENVKTIFGKGFL